MARGRPRGQGQGVSRNHPRSVLAYQHRMQIIELALQGVRPTEIGRQIGLAQSTVSHLLARLMSHQDDRERIAQLRELESTRLEAERERLEGLMDTYWKLAEGAAECLPAFVALDAAWLRNRARFARINGLDAPEKAPVGPDGRAVPYTINVIYEDQSQTLIQQRAALEEHVGNRAQTAEVA